MELKFPGADFTEYFDFIESRPVLTEGGHKHHIAPRAEFPELVKDKSNLIKLSYTDHFYAHYYLALALPQCQAFQYAFYLMANTIASEANQRLLPQFAEMYSRAEEANSERSKSPEFKTVCREGRMKKFADSEFRAAYSESIKKGMHTRFHLNRGITREDCRFCILSNLAIN